MRHHHHHEKRHRWILIDRGHNTVFAVGLFEDVLIEQFFEKFAICIKEKDSVEVHVGWIYHKNYDGSHYYSPPLPHHHHHDDEEKENDRASPIPKEVMMSVAPSKPKPEVSGVPSQKKYIRVEAVIVCKDYSDFLDYTLPENLQHFDDIIVVTHPDDKKTQAICAKYSVECVKTTVFQEKGHSFNKGAAINIGLDHLLGGDWYAQMDADIMVCRDFKRLLEKAHLNEKNIYGADRVNIYGFDNFQSIKPRLSSHYQSRWFVDPGMCHAEEVPDGMRFGTRVVHMEHGWTPIGYFQMWHSSTGNRYNYKRGAAAGTDIMFPAQWPRENRVLLPEIVVYHLDSEPNHGIGTNWKGRKSRKFEPGDNK